MNYSIVIKVIGILLIIEAAFMIPAQIIAIFYHQSDSTAFFISIFIIAITGFLMANIKTNDNKIKTKEGLAIVALGWLFSSVFGALPFVISGSIPSYVDAFFETVSGFTTTGATILNDIEALPRGILFWRSFTHWMGGMGILVFTVALLPTIGVGGFQIFKAESPGPIADKIVPHIKDTAKILYITYISFTIIEIILLVLGGMSLYDAALHTFGTVGTGGFSNRNASIGAFDSTYIHLVITIFMILSGANFSLYFAIYKGKWRYVVKNEELRFYLLIILAATVLIGTNIFLTTYDGDLRAFRDALFQVSSIITTTGYTTADFDQWPTFSKSILFVLMFIGGSAGSTGGGMKNIRILVLLKLVKREIAKIFHPRAIIPIKIQNKSLARDINASISSFFVLYLFLFIIGTILISLENIDLESAASAVAATLGNVGPGFGFVGPTRTYSDFSNFSKIILSMLMLFGRLELFTIIALITPKNWRNEK
ncbi:potassium transporter KefA [Vulcanibacillus modesticaldus]|uniref:Potassium transporter KefA n=1 Tax=Vulcanibacillus modesticaldus TaxID=337097 RepID=A0A1D2YSQ9_9BACI|nr:TrkH family potassium uptake protein [Vulcanibacillus modesticaldus]OEF97740.1 potassium transporter KefA [Vulcanibacillus modesticaldus]